jgi:hypothetical protein
MALIHMPTAQTMTLYEEITARDFMLEQKDDELAFESLRVCELEQVVEELSERAARAEALELKVTELSMTLECLLRERQAEQANAKWVQEATAGYESPEEGYCVPLPSNGLVVNPGRWYSAA